jgi:hypothetical protein
MLVLRPAPTRRCVQVKVLYRNLATEVEEGLRSRFSLMERADGSPGGVPGFAGYGGAGGGGDGEGMVRASLCGSSLHLHLYLRVVSVWAGG